MIDFTKLPTHGRSPRLKHLQALPDSTIRRTLSPLLPVALLCGLLGSAHAQTKWSASGDGFWKDVANWDAGAPASGGNVTIDNAGSKVVTIDNATPLGNLTIGNLIVKGAGTATNELLLNNSDQWLQVNGSNLYIESNSATSLGNLVIDGGLLRTGSTLRFGYNFSGRGKLEMRSGAIEAFSAVFGSHNIGTHGTLAMSGGSIKVVDAIRFGSYTNGVGIGTMTGGTVTAAEVYIGGSPTATIGSHGSLDVSGSAVLDTGGVYVRLANVTTGDPGSASLVVRDGGTLQFSKAAPLVSTSATGVTFKIKDAVVSYRGVSNANINYGTLATYATFEGKNTFRLNNANNQSVSSYVFASDLGAANYARLELTGANSRWQSTFLTIGNGGELSVSDAEQAAVTATVTSTGAVSVSTSDLTWNGTLALQGSYASDDAANIFTQNVTIGASGSFAGSNGSTFEFRRDLVNQSTDTDSFDLLSSTVAFTSGAGHVLNLTGSASLELGLNGFRADNMAIGTLAIELDNQVTITGVSGVNALYVGVLDLSEWDTSEAALLLALQEALDLSAGVHLYYDSTLLGNAYLSGMDYDLWGGGQLRAIPEPSTLAFASMAFLAVMVARRRRLA